MEPSGTAALKVYSYLRSGRAVLYIGEGGSTTDLLARFDGTFALARSSWPELATWLSQHQTVLNRTFSRGDIGVYSFESITSRMIREIRSRLEGRYRRNDFL